MMQNRPERAHLIKGGFPSGSSAGLSTEFETLIICFERYSCHIAAHTAIVAVQALLAEQALRPADIAGVNNRLECIESQADLLWLGCQGGNA